LCNGIFSKKNAEIASKILFHLTFFADNPEIFGAKSNNKNGGKSSRQMAYRAVFTRELVFFFSIVLIFFLSFSLILAVIFSVADLEISYHFLDFLTYIFT
jgi:hypothetical protein